MSNDHAAALEADHKRALELWNEHRHDEALALFRELAEAGHAAAMNELATHLQIADPPDFAQAANWLARGAALGDARAQYNYAVALIHGRGVAPDLAQGLLWLEKSAAQRNAYALRDLGVACSKGEGVAADPNRAVELWRGAAEQGDVPAQYFLAIHLIHGEGVPSDPAEGMRWMARSAAGGCVPAQQYLMAAPTPADGFAAVAPPATVRARFHAVEWEQLKLLPLSLFNLVASADGDITAAELDLLAAQLTKSDYADPLAQELFADIRSSNARALMEQAADMHGIAPLHDQCARILRGALSDEEYRSFTTVLFDNARAVASSKPSQPELAVLSAIARRFAILDAGAKLH